MIVHQPANHKRRSAGVGHAPEALGSPGGAQAGTGTSLLGQRTVSIRAGLVATSGRAGRAR
jgi:hypothetical protein